MCCEINKVRSKHEIIKIKENVKEDAMKAALLRMRGEEWLGMSLR